MNQGGINLSFARGALTSCVVLAMLGSCSSAPGKGDIEAYPQDVKAQVSGLTVSNLRGEKIDLPSLWADRRILLVFMRHFG